MNGQLNGYLVVFFRRYLPLLQMSPLAVSFSHKKQFKGKLKDKLQHLQNKEKRECFCGNILFVKCIFFFTFYLFFNVCKIVELLGRRKKIIFLPMAKRKFVKKFHAQSLYSYFCIYYATLLLNNDVYKTLDQKPWALPRHDMAAIL